MAISKSQALLLADGFLNGLGSSRAGLQPRETLSELFLLVGELVEDAQDNLNRDNSNASGKLSKTIHANEPQVNNSHIKIDVLMEYYGQFVNSGVKGTESGNGKFRFKSPYPSKDMVKALEKSIKRAGNSIFNTNRHKTISANEKKNANISDIEKAYGAGRNIKMFGIKATGFMDKAIKATERKVSDRLGTAIQIDIINSFK